MKYLSTLCSRGGIGRRKGLKIRSGISQYWLVWRLSLKNTLAMSAVMSVINCFDRPNFVASLNLKYL